MNTRVGARINITHPPNAIKAQLGDSGRTIKTSEMSSEMSMNDCDSVVSEITLDPAFASRGAMKKDPSFYKNVIVQQQNGAAKSRPKGQQLLPQETVSKLDGNDFLDGKFKSAFHKEASEGLIQQDEQVRTATLKQTLVEKKLATEYANRKKAMSNAKLDDLPENSLMDMFTSVNLAVEVPDAVKKEEQRQRRRRSSEIKKRRENGKEHDVSLEISFDLNDGTEGKQRRRRSRKTHDESRDIVFNPSESNNFHESNASTFIPSESNNFHESNASTFIPPPHLPGFQDIADDSQDQEQPEGQSDHRPSEITVLPEELVDETQEKHVGIREKQPRRSSKQRRRSTASKKPPAFKKRLPFEDVPLSITIEDDNTLVSEMFCPVGLADIEEEKVVIDSKEEDHHSPSRRRHSTSQVRRSRKPDRSESPRRRRHHSTERGHRLDESSRRKSEPSASPRRRRHSATEREPSRSRSSHHRSSPRHRSRSSHADYKKSSTHHSKLRSSSRHRRHSSQEEESESQQSKEDNVIKIPSIEEEKGDDPLSQSLHFELERDDKKEEEESPEDTVDVLREPAKMRRTYSAPELASPMLNSQGTEEEAISPLSEGLHKSFTPTTPATMTSSPRKKSLWKRISQRSMRPISSLSNERSESSLRSLRNSTPSSPSKQSLTDSGSFSKRSMSSSSSSDLGSSKGGSERSLPSPPPSIQSQPQATGSQVIIPKARKQYTPTVVHGSTQTLSYSERVMQGKIGISILKPTPEGTTLEEF